MGSDYNGTAVPVIVEEPIANGRRQYAGQTWTTGNQRSLGSEGAKEPRSAVPSCHRR